MIYFIKSKSDKRIKIGTTVRLSHRLRELAREFGDELTVLAVAEGSFDQERELHQRFAHLRAVGEWFEPGDDLIGFILEEGKPWDGRDEKHPSKFIRVSDDFAAAITRAASFKEISVAEFATKHLLPIVERLYRDDVLKEAKRVKGEEP